MAYCDEEETYGSSVVGLAKVTVDTRGGGGVDNATVLLLKEVGPSSLGDLVGTAEVDVHDRVPEVVVHVGEGLVAQDTGVVDNDVNAAKGINGTLDDNVTILSGGLDTSSLATSSADLANNGVRIHQIVDNDRGASLGEGVSVGAADTSTTTGDEGNLAGEVELLALLAGTHLHGLLKQREEVVGASRVLGILGEVDNLVPLLEDGTRSVRGVGLEEETVGALPAELGSEAATDLEDATVLGVVLVGEDSNEGNDELGAESVENLRRHDGGSHARSGNGGNDVGENVVLGTLFGQSLGETNHGELGSRVVGLAEAAVETSSRGSVDDATVLLLAEVRPGGAGNLVGAGDVDLHDQVPVLVGQVLEADVTEDTGVVDDNVDTAESLDGGVDDLLTELDGVVVGDGLAAGSLDFVDDDISSLRIAQVSHAFRTVQLSPFVKCVCSLPLWSYPRP